MKNFTFISAIVLSLQFVNAQAAGDYECLEFNAPVSPSVNLGLVPDDNACAIVRGAKDKYLPDITLLNDSEEPLPFPIPFPGFPLCFTGNFNGNLGGTSVIVTTNSALTENYLTDYNSLPDHELADLTAATVVSINLPPTSDGRPGRKLWTVYTQDVFLDPPSPPFVNPAFMSDTREYLTVVDGPNHPKGHLVIEGDAAALGTTMKGKLCFRDN